MAVTRQQVAELYVATFNRAPDAAGLDYWVNVSGLTIEGIAQSFFDQPETQALYPEGNTNTQFVTSIYTNLFNRVPDTDGLAYWVAELNNATMTRSVMIEAMKNGALGSDAVIIANKTEVALYYADTLGLEGTDFSLASVTTDTATVYAAKLSANAESAFTLTNSVDVATANTFNSAPAYTPGGDNFINTLQNEDVLTGIGIETTLNATLGSVNDGAESMISPVLNNINTVNLGITGNISGMDFQDTTGMTTLNINRVIADNADIVMYDLQDGVNALSVTNATRDGSLEFNYAEGALEGTNDGVTLTLDNVRQNLIAISQGSGNINDDAFEDEGYSFESVTVNVTGSTNLDKMIIAANDEEQRASLEAGNEKVTQAITINAVSNLEINNLVANGAESITINATGDVVLTANERTNADENINYGLDYELDAAVVAAELETMTITGSGKVTINDISTDNTAGVVIDGSAMTGILAISLGDADILENSDSLLSSGSGNDEILLAAFNDQDPTSTEEVDAVAMSVTTNAGNDRIIVGADMNGAIDSGAGSDRIDVLGSMSGTLTTGDGVDTINIHGTLSGVTTTGEGADTLNVDEDITASVNTGSGADTVNVTGDINADMDTGLADDVAADGDTVNAVNLNNANLVTGAGADVITLTGDITNNTDASTTVNTGSEDDTLTVSGNLDSNVSVMTEDGNDVVSFGGTTAGTISTADGDDTVTIAGDVTGAIDLGTGVDTLTIGTALISANLDAAVTAGSDAETDNADGLDTVTVHGDMLGHASITTQAGDDVVTVGNLLTADADYVGNTDVTTESDADTINAKGADKTADNSNVDVTVAATIVTGEGNDTVTALSLSSAAQFNDNVVLNDENNDDTVTVVGALIDTGAGDDHVYLTQNKIATEYSFTVTINGVDFTSTGLSTGETEDALDALIDASGIAGVSSDQVSPTTGYFEVTVPTGMSISLAGGTLNLISSSAESDVYAINLQETNPTSFENYGDSTLIAENALVSTGNDNDTVVAEITGGVILEADNAKAGVYSAVENDTLGAKIDLGEGDDSLTFNDSVVDDSETLVVDAGAVIDGGAGSDTLNINTTDTVDVVKSTTYEIGSEFNGNLYVQQDTAVGATPNGGTDAIAGYGQGGSITGVETINLTVNDAVADNSGDLILDVQQVDSALTTLNLTSLETRHANADIHPIDYSVETSTSTTINGAPVETTTTIITTGVDVNVEQGLSAGDVNTFEVVNFRSDVALSLSANEVTGLVEEAATADATHVNHVNDIDPDADLNPVDYTAMHATDDCEIDVNVAVNMDAQNTLFDQNLAANIDENRSFAINLEAGSNDSNYDVALSSETTLVEFGVGESGDTTSDEIDSRDARDIVINVNTQASHLIDLTNTFGNVADSVYQVFGEDADTLEYYYIDTVE
ncbi:MAG: DUF4214 domain-containing protein, partial [Sulfurimonas sp.]|uniref:DUF4214 domain-containing protein n=1 Tax=Sulfurimonas sp. TaxID=2022749 RepID=UPI00262774E5